MAKSALPLIAAGGAALLFVSGSGKKGKKKKKGRWGVSITNKCKTITVYDADLLMDFLFNGYKELMDADPDLTALQVTDALFGDIAPHCSGFPEKPESPAIVEFYTFIARHVSMFMVDDPDKDVTPQDMIDQATSIAFDDWYKQWRNYPSSEIQDAPSSQVAFSSDLSKYEIGSDWYNENIKPFAQEAKAAGRADSAFEDYVETRGVLVGSFVEPISELPADKDTVDDFLDKLEDALDRTLAEASA